jgi:hypothetical protein
MDEDTSHIYADKSSDEMECDTVQESDFDTCTDSSDDEESLHVSESLIKMFKNYKSYFNNLTNQDVQRVKVRFFYVNLQNEIDTKISDEIDLENGVLTKERLLHLIKNNRILDGFKYRLISLLKYNIDVSSEEIEKFIYLPTESDKYLKDEKYLYDIQFNKTIKFFQDVNALYFIFKQIDNVNRNSLTKKIIFEKKLNKTKRKMA